METENQTRRMLLISIQRSMARLSDHAALRLRFSRTVESVLFVPFALAHRDAYAGRREPASRRGLFPEFVTRSP